eukprot:4531229-Heterocapsa_arctica.AAC.1
MQRRQGIASHTRRSRAHAGRPTGSFADMQTVMYVTSKECGGGSHDRRHKRGDHRGDRSMEEQSMFWTQA